MIEKVVRPLPKLARFYKEYIIDLETTGLEKEDIIICMGIADLHKLKSTIYFLNDHTKWKQFQQFCKRKAKELLKQGKVWAYNKEFEEKFLEIKGLHELLCMYGRHYRYKLIDACLEIIDRYKLNINKELYNEPISGKDIPLLYLRNFIIFKDEKTKWLIIDHNYNDLVRSYIVRIHIGKIAEEIIEKVLGLELIPKEIDTLAREYLQLY